MTGRPPSSSQRPCITPRMHANNLATWATIVGPVLAVIGIFFTAAPAVNPHQRKTSRTIAGILSVISDARSNCFYRQRRQTAFGVLNGASSKLRALERDGLLSPGPSRIEELRRATKAFIQRHETDAKRAATDAATWSIDHDPFGFWDRQPTTHEREQYLKALVDELFTASVKMDNGNILVYYKYRRARRSSTA